MKNKLSIKNNDKKTHSHQQKSINKTYTIIIYSSLHDKQLYHILLPNDEVESVEALAADGPFIFLAGVYLACLAMTILPYG